MGWSGNWVAVTHAETLQHVKDVALLIQSDDFVVAVSKDSHAEAPPQLALVGHAVGALQCVFCLFDCVQTIGENEDVVNEKNQEEELVAWF